MEYIDEESGLKAVCENPSESLQVNIYDDNKKVKSFVMQDTDNITLRYFDTCCRNFFRNYNSGDE